MRMAMEVTRQPEPAMVCRSPRAVFPQAESPCRQVV